MCLEYYLTMSPKSKKSLDLLRIVKKLKINEREQLIGYLNDNGIDALSECVYNIVCDGSNKLSKGALRKLKRGLVNNKQNLRVIGDKSISMKRRKKALLQEGGSLGLILSAAIPLLTSLISGAVSK